MLLKLVVLAVVGLLVLYGIYTYVSVREVQEGKFGGFVKLKGEKCVGSSISAKYILLNLDLDAEYESRFRATLKSLDVDLFVENAFAGWANLTREVPLRRGEIHLPINVTLPVARLPYLLFELANSSLRPIVRATGKATVHHPLLRNLNIDVEFSKRLDLTGLEEVNLSGYPISLDGVSLNGFTITDLSVRGSDLLANVNLNYDGAEEVYGNLKIYMGPLEVADIEIRNETGRAEVNVPGLVSIFLDLFSDGRTTLALCGKLILDGGERHIDEVRSYAIGKNRLCEIVNNILSS